MNSPTDIAVRENVSHLLYPISYNDMVQSWLNTMHADENMVVIYDPSKHIQFLQNMGFSIPKDEMWESKLLMVQVFDIDDAMWIVKNIDVKKGPYCQAWIKSRYITDNIDK